MASSSQPSMPAASISQGAGAPVTARTSASATIPTPPQEKPPWYEGPVGGGLLALLGVLIGLALAHRRMKTELKAAAERQRLDLQHSAAQSAAERQHSAAESELARGAGADAAQRERLYQARRTLYLEVLAIASDIQRHLAALTTVDITDQVALHGPFTMLTSRVAQMSMLSEVDTLMAARELVAETTEIFTQAMAHILPIASERIARDRAQQELDAASLEAERHQGVKNAFSMLGHERARRAANASAERVGDAQRRLSELTIQYQSWVTDAMFALTPQFNKVQALMRQELGVPGNFSLLEAQSRDHVGRAATAIQIIINLAKDDDGR